jgi:hypothetical protein
MAMLIEPGGPARGAIAPTEVRQTGIHVVAALTIFCYIYLQQKKQKFTIHS